MDGRVNLGGKRETFVNLWPNSARKRSQSAITCSMLTTETLEQGVNYVQS